jgi:hypothetical protein
MTRRKALTIALSVAGVSGLMFVLLLLSSKPEPVEARASYAWKPGCHCGAPTTTTAKKVTTTTKKVATTTAKPKATTTTTKKASTTTATSTVQKSTTTQSTAGKPSTTKAAAKKTKKSTTTTSESQDDPNDALAIGASVASFPGDGDGSSGGRGISGGEPVAAAVSGPPQYYFSPVAIGFLAVYGVSFGLYRTRRMKVTTHRKIWNMLLLATFLLCGLIGLLLAVGVTRSTPWALPSWLLVWHVETGIAMCFISFFHIGWHARYYLAIVTGKRRAARPERTMAPERAKAPERGAAREPVSRPRHSRPATVRTAEERRLAFAQRQAARVEHTTAVQPARPGTDAERWLEERRGVVPAS